MQQIFALVSALLTIFAGCWVGLRLLSLSRRTGELPERVIAIGMLSFSAVAYPLFVLNVATEGGMPTALEIGVSFGAHTGYLMSLVMLASFTRIVFRPGSIWGWVAVGTVTLIQLAGAVLWLKFTIENPHVANSNAWEIRLGGTLVTTALGLQFLWTSLEAFLYSLKLRKRLALGLTDAVAVNRMTTWCFGSGLVAVIDVGILTCLALGVDPLHNALPGLLQSSGGLASGLTWMLTFTPPKSYIERIKQRAVA